MDADEIRRAVKYGRTLKAIAQYINTRFYDGLTATVEQWTARTDRHWRGSRLRWPGKGRTGSRIKIKKGEFLLLDHKNSKTYRRVSEVTKWLEKWESGEPVDQYGHYKKDWRRG